jgi:hypothetical protein
MSPRFPHCPIAPGKGCQSCEDMAEIVATAVRAEWRRNVLAALFVAAVAGALLFGMWLVSR